MISYSFVNSIDEVTDSYPTPYEALYKGVGCIVREIKDGGTTHMNVEHILRRFTADLALGTADMWTDTEYVFEFLRTLNPDLRTQVEIDSRLAGTRSKQGDKVKAAAWMANCASGEEISNYLAWNCIGNGVLAGIDKGVVVADFNGRIMRALDGLERPRSREVKLIRAYVAAIRSVNRVIELSGGKPFDVFELSDSTVEQLLALLNIKY